MSWIIGSISSESSLRKSIQEIHPSPLFTSKSLDKYIAAGGNPFTCQFSQTESNSGWALAGTGMSRSNNDYKIMDLNDWREYLVKKNSFQYPINGHYVLLSWNGSNLKIETDPLGLREIYLYFSDNFLLFSTRIDWIGKITKTDFDIKNLGSAWFLSSQISNESLLKDVVRITKCKECIIDKKSYNIKLWDEVFDPKIEASPEEFYTELETMINSLYLNSESFELSLSGGLDSRLLLSYLLKNNKQNIKTHTFGNPKHPDNKIAHNISEKLNFKHRNIYLPPEQNKNLIEEIEEFILQKRLTNPITEYLNLRYYNYFKSQTIIIDGGFGELWRNESLYRLKTTEKNAVISKSINSLFRLLSFNRADIFKEEVILEMKNQIRPQIEKLFSDTIGYDDIGLSNMLDILLFNIKMPNFISPEQTRIDNYAICIMPFVQPSVLRLFLGLNDELKINGNLFRSIIKKNCPQLENFKLVKNNVIRSYYSGSMKTRVVNRLKERLGLAYNEPDKLKLLYLLREYANDLANSQSVKEYHLYDYKKIRTLVEDFYNGNATLSSEVNWWLSFEIFRKYISAN